jgi:hypothetical protein
MCNHRGGSVYRSSDVAGYIRFRWINDFQKGKTMTQNSLIHVIWDFPVMLFNIGAKKIRKYVADRENEEARWLNG